MKNAKPLTSKGASTAEELYILVGSALSWWESSEDLILGLFRQLCDDIEPVAVEWFVKSTRKSRYSMLEIAMKKYHYRFEDGEINLVSKALRGLDKLAQVRNEIAHGNVAGISIKEGDFLVAEGNYLMPSLHEGGFQERSFRYHHTTATIKEFEQQLRTFRGHIMDVWGAMVNRTQGRIHTVANGFAFVQKARCIARLESFGIESVREMKELIGQIERFNIDVNVASIAKPDENL